MLAAPLNPHCCLVLSLQAHFCIVRLAILLSQVLKPLKPQSTPSNPVQPPYNPSHPLLMQSSCLATRCASPWGGVVLQEREEVCHCSSPAVSFRYLFPLNDLMLKYYRKVTYYNQGLVSIHVESKHLKGRLGPHVGHVTFFLDERRSVGSPCW